MIPEHYLFGSLFYAFIDRLFYKTALEVHTLYIRPGYSSCKKYMISYRHFLVGEILYAKVQRRTVAKYRCANGSRIFTAAFHKSKIWVFRFILSLFTCLVRPMLAVCPA